MQCSKDEMGTHTTLPLGSLKQISMRNHPLGCGVYLSSMLRRASWSRWVAMVLLLWGMLDLTVPGFCQTDFTDIQAIASQMHAASEASTPQPHGARVAQHKPQHSPTPAESNSDSDDCWCCCSHIVTPVAPVSLVTLERVLDHPAAASEEGPTWRSAEFFQPPKL